MSVNSTMVTPRRDLAHKLSTGQFRRSRFAHNRRMNVIDNAGSLGRFLTLADTAEVLNISATHAYALVRSGELPAIKIGGRGQWRIERTVLEAYIEGKYEETRRIALWNQSEYSLLPEYSFDPERGGRTTPLA